MRPTFRQRLKDRGWRRHQAKMAKYPYITVTDGQYFRPGMAILVPKWGAAEEIPLGTVKGTVGNRVHYKPTKSARYV